MLKTFNTTLIEKKQLTIDIILLKFALISGEQLEFSAGQYMIFKFNGLSRLYSIFSSSNIKNYFELLVKIMPGGKATTSLNNLKVGDNTVFQGPAGAFIFKKNDKDKIFLATGTGFSPVRSMIISNLVNLGPNFYLFWGLPYFSEVCLMDELIQLTTRFPNFNFSICLSREKDLNMISETQRKFFLLGRVNIGLEKLIKQKTTDNFDYYICGSKIVVESLRELLYQKKITKESVFFEHFGLIS